MPRIRLPAHIIHAPQAIRTGGRRTLRHHMEAWTTGGQLGVGQAKLPTKEDGNLRPVLRAAHRAKTKGVVAMGKVL